MDHFNTAHCDAAGCDTWSRTPREHGFLFVEWDEALLIFCSTDCLLREVAARSTPGETVEF